MPGLAAEVVDVKVRHVEKLFQPFHHVQELLFLDAVQLHHELIDALQRLIGQCGQRFPLGAFHVHFHDDMVRGVAVLLELAEHGVERPAVFRSRNAADAFGMKEGPARFADGHLVLKQSYWCTGTFCRVETSQPQPS